MSSLRVCLLVVLTVSSVRSAKVQTNVGEVEGGEYITDSGKKIFSFLGVPYAKPPVGDNRFKEPKPLRNWVGVWPAKEYSPACIQLVPAFQTPEFVTGNEDCLYLNIFSPSLSNASNLPVLVYFHGGAFMFGESTFYKPTFLFENNDLVYVSVNYRLGPFGFLSTQDNVVPGNNGLKDQSLALKWVQENIAHFGGDNQKVTIAGNSAGGASVHLHYLSPMSRGLFARGISSSGSPLMPWAFTEEPLQKAKVLANSLLCPTDNNEIMIKCLRQRPSRQICSQLRDLFQPWMSNPFTPFGPVVENTTRQSFLSEHPYQMLAEGNVYDCPLLASITTEEGLYPAGLFVHRQDLLKSLNDEWHNIAPHLLDYNYTVPSHKKDFVSDKIKSFYFGNADISVDTRDKVVEMMGDRLFSADMNHAMRLHASSTTSPVFFYIFAYRGEGSLSEFLSGTKENFGTSHFDDIYYLLSPVEYGFMLQSEADKAMKNAMINIWASFIKTGQPTLLSGSTWKAIPQDAITTGQLPHILIKSHDSMVSTVSENVGNYNFWNSLGLIENIKYNNILGVKDEL